MRLRLYSAIMIALACLLPFTSYTTLYASSVIYPDGTKKPISVKQVNGLPYVSLLSLAEAFGASTYWAPEKMKMVLRWKGGSIKVTAFNPIVVVGEGRNFNLPEVPTFIDGSLYVPAGPFIRIADEVVAGDLRWDGRDIIVKERARNILGLKVEERANGTMVIINTAGKLPVEHNTGSPGWFNLSIYGGILSAEDISSNRPRGSVRRIKAYQYEDSAQISFLVDTEIKDIKVYQAENPDRIIILMRKNLPGRTASVVTEPQPDRNIWSFHTVVVDAGHGERDPGAIGRGGTMEKDVTLDIAKRLARLLKDRLGVKVIMTRTGDEFVGLAERARIANRNGGKIFISIHTNASRKPGMGGIETYFLSEAKTEEAEEVARRENSSIRFEEPSEVEGIDLEDFSLADIQLDMISDQCLKESQDLAALIQSELVRSLRLKDRGVKQAGFYVLKGTAGSMPSVLVEVGFISNRYEEKLLKSRGFRQRAAEAIYRAVKAFKQMHESGI